MTDQRKPLWLLMRDAVVNAPPSRHSPAGSIAAVQLRAIAAWLEEMWAEQGPGPATDGVAFIKGMKIGRGLHREGTLSVLRREAGRAERGEE